ncbi:MAG: L,D-transpeptidase [Lachnospiraceae bacterium]|nr:L,D-transpeptidase [Lachnospiraceae bacterium]
MRLNRKTAILAMVLILTVLTLPEQAEAVALSSVFDARPDYAVYVNRAMNCVTVYHVDEQGNTVPVKSMTCSCGRKGHGTPEGSFQTSDYYDWRLMVDGTYGRYAVRFNRRILFHSVPYSTKSPDSLEWDQYNLLGESASLGCVRLSVADAKWIYDNCKPGTTVVVYSDSETPGALGKPVLADIDPNAPERGWDPTDTSASNPWKQATIQ